MKVALIGAELEENLGLRYMAYPHRSNCTLLSPR
jgi:hypothetical protein